MINNTTLLTIFMITVLSLLSGCSKKADENPDRVTLRERSFYMGIIDFPYEYKTESWITTLDTINSHTDLFSIHLDAGIPWVEAYENRPYHENARYEMLFRNIHRNPRAEKVYLAMTPLNSTRNKLAKYWASDSNLPLPEDWKDAAFDDPRVIQGYINFCLHAIDLYKPDYINYCIECNENWKGTDDEKFLSFLTLLDTVYSHLKQEYPETPVFMSFYVDGFRGTQQDVNQELLKYSDMVAVSTYPFWDRSHIENEAKGHIPDGWFSDLADLAPDKPFGVAETGYIAENLVTCYNSSEINIAGTESWQAEYVKNLFSITHQMNAEFVIWAVSIDYDKAYQTHAAQKPCWFGLWRDTGLIDGELNSRESLGVWDKWYRFKKVNK